MLSIIRARSWYLGAATAGPALTPRCRCLLKQDALIHPLSTLRDVQSRVLFKETARLQANHHGLARHDGIVFRSRVMRQADRVPQHNILVVHLVTPLCPSSDISLVYSVIFHSYVVWERLVGVITCGIEFSIAVGRDPVRVKSELSPLAMP
ncbi:unnamed protein product [Clonostachys byssicola]|uniref:Uncharacterized protein n=1 Tax=Clonostachys byssicola TaxID=160290 RepID=A0A9N9U353_9HYPO|nr:unnamed protein product [Clonostachys byssicola]